MMEVSEKCAQRPAHRLPGNRAQIPGVALDVAGDVLLADLAEVAGAGRAHLTQEPADDRQVANDGLRRQTAFPSQIIAELPEYLVLRGDPSAVSPAQSCPPRATQTATASAPPGRPAGWTVSPLGAGGTARPCVHRDRPASSGFLRSNSGDRRPIEAPPSAMANEPVFDETRRVELNELSVGSTLQAPEQPAPVKYLLQPSSCPPLLRAEHRNYAESTMCPLRQILGKTSPFGIVRRAA